MKNCTLKLSQAEYVEKVLNKFNMHGAKPVSTPLVSHFKLSKELSPKTEQEKENMFKVPYASAVGSLMYAMVCTRPDIAHVVGVVSRFMSNPGKMHWEAVKWILRYLRGTTKAALHFGGSEIKLHGYVDSGLRRDLDRSRSTTGYVFTLGSATVRVGISNRIGNYIAGYERKGATEQARYLQIKVELSIDKPLRRGGLMTSPEGESCWVDYKYERLSTLCYAWWRLGHELKVCSNRCHGEEEEPMQYGEWLRASFNGKLVVPCKNNKARGVSGPKSLANIEEVQGASMSIDLEKGEVETGKIVKQQCADMGVPSEVISIAFIDEAKVELALGLGQKSTLVVEKVSTPMRYGHAIEEIYGVGGATHIGEGKLNYASLGTFDTVTKAHSDKAEVYATRDSDSVGARKVSNTTNRDGVELGTKMGHVGLLQEKGALQLLLDGDRRAQSKWKRYGKSSLMQTEMGGKITKGVMFGNKRERDEITNPNMQPFVSKKLRYVSDYMVVDGALEAAAAGQQPR
ncbi:hypothetical protein AAC387_Pa02g1763 [Persea americana]